MIHEANHRMSWPWIPAAGASTAFRQPHHSSSFILTNLQNADHVCHVMMRTLTKALHVLDFCLSYR